MFNYEEKLYLHITWFGQRLKSMPLNPIHTLKSVWLLCGRSRIPLQVTKLERNNPIHRSVIR